MSKIAWTYVAKTCECVTPKGVGGWVWPDKDAAKESRDLIPDCAGKLALKKLTLPNGWKKDTTKHPDHEGVWTLKVEAKFRTMADRPVVAKKKVKKPKRDGP